MLIEAALLPRNLLNEGNYKLDTQFYAVSVRTFVTSVYYVSAKPISYGSYDSDSATLSRISKAIRESCRFPFLLRNGSLVRH
jgi:hypothetical protein